MKKKDQARSTEPPKKRVPPKPPADVIPSAARNLVAAGDMLGASNIRPARKKAAADPRATAARQTRLATSAAEGDVLALALQQNDFERAALLLLLGVSMAARALEATTIDDVLTLLCDGEGAT
jgi:hypothetical protein